MNAVFAFLKVTKHLFGAYCLNGRGNVKETLHEMAAADVAMGFKNKLRKQVTLAPTLWKLTPEPIAWSRLKSRIMLVKFMSGLEL